MKLHRVSEMIWQSFHWEVPDVISWHMDEENLNPGEYVDTSAEDIQLDFWINKHYHVACTPDPLSGVILEKYFHVKLVYSNDDTF